jgi:ABC-type glycerol-3-phosphate transport system permease component
MPAVALRRTLDATVRLLILLGLAAATLFPLAWAVSGSLKPLEQVFTIPVQWIPNPIQPQNYPNAIEFTKFARPLLNSVIVTSSQIAINVVLCSLAGFGFAKYRFPGREQLFLGVLAMTLLPLQVIMIPLFVIVKELGWVNTYQGLILPTAASAFGVFFMRQYISTIPTDYLDAARVDGAGELAVFRKIVLPQCRPALITLSVLVALSSWDEFLWPLMGGGGRELATASLAVAQLRSLYQTPFHYVLAVAVVMVIPPFVAFLFAQRQIIQSVSQTGIK